MSEVIDLPAIEPAMIDQPAAMTAAPVAPTKQATLKETALASFVPIVAHMQALAARYEKVAFDLKTPKGLAEAKAARLELREDGRYAVQRLQKRLKDEANDLKRTIDEKADEAIAIVRPVEDAIHTSIEARESEIEAEKEAKRQAEAARVAAHRDRIATIRAYLDHAKAPGMTAERIGRGMDMLRSITVGPECEEFAVETANAQCETLEAMRVLQEAAAAREAEAARLEAQRLENERIAAEQRAQAEALAAQQRALAEQAAALARQQREIEAARQRAEASAAPVATAAATEGKADNPEPDKLEAAQDTQQDSQHVLKAEAAGPDATDRDAPAHASPVGGPMGAGQPAAAGPVAILLQDEAEGGSLSRALASKPDAMLHAREAAQAIADDESLETSEREARPYHGPAQMVEPAAGPAARTDALLDACADVLALVSEARAGKFPSQPKPGPEWWAALYAAADRIVATGEVA